MSKPMDPAVADAILAVARTLPKKLRGVDASVVIDTWARARGWSRDRWGHFVPREGERIDEGRTVVRFQYKSAGTWHTRSSFALIGYANALIHAAAALRGETALVEKSKALHTERKAAKVSRADKTKDKELTARAHAVAVKVLAHRYPKETLANARGQTLDAVTFARMKEELDSDVIMLKGLLGGGRPPPPDGSWVSVEKPPFLPIYGSSAYTWVETVAGHRYTVQIRHRDSGGAEVEIGSTGSDWLAIDQATMSARMVMPTRERPEGDAHLLGTVDDRDANGTLRGTLNLIGTRGDAQNAGGGPRVALLWCRLMTGYGIKHWLATRLTLEGERFLIALQKRGSVKVLAAEGRNAVLSCREAS